jgi:hypothetical protein
LLWPVDTHDLRLIEPLWRCSIGRSTTTTGQAELATRNRKL